MKYADKLQDPRWKRKAAKIRDYADHRCQICGAQEISLQVHHSYYISGAEPWEYPDGSLIALCDDCHGRIVHGIEFKQEELDEYGRLSKKQQFLVDALSVLEILPTSGLPFSEWRDKALNEFGIGRTRFQRLMRELIQSNRICLNEHKYFKK